MSGPPGQAISPLIPDLLDATLVLVRHGESEYIVEGRFQGQAETPLSSTGLRQAALVAERLAHPHDPPALPLPLGPLLEVVHSPLRRAAQTAEAILGPLDMPPTARPEPGLLEIGQGEWEGLPGAQVVERWGDVLDGWRRDPLSAWAPGGEGLHEVDLRVRAALHELLDELAAAEPATSIGRSPVLGYAELPSDEPWSIVVGHDGVFKVALLAVLDLPLARFWTFPFALCGITIVEIRDGRPRLRLHNATDHLASLETEAERSKADERRGTGAL